VPDEIKNLPAVVNRGRPKGDYIHYREEIVEEIIDRLCHGETLTMICRTDCEGYDRERGDFPSYQMIYAWADPNDPRHHDDFGLRFARARLINQDYLLDTTVDVSRSTQIGVEETREVGGKDGTKLKRTHKDMLGHRQLQVDTIHKYLSRINPTKWAERLQQPTAKDDDSSAPDRLIIEGGLPDNEPPPPSAPPTAAPSEEP
jgi:hypothetical protein